MVEQKFIELFEEYTHSMSPRMPRRVFLERLTVLAGSSAAAYALLPLLENNYANAETIPANDPRIKATDETFPATDGVGVKAYVVKAANATGKLPTVIVIHENRGLNPHTEDVARRFALENFIAFAPDALSSTGGYPGDDFKGGELFSKLDPAKRTQDFVAAARWLKARPECSGKIASTGFCFGGGLSNTLAVLLGDDLAAAAPFYGTPAKPEDVPKIKGAMLIHHGGLDKALAEGYPAQEAELKKNKVRYEGHVYPNSVHGFFNDATPERYNKTTAQQAWTRTIEWFNQHARV